MDHYSPPPLSSAEDTDTGRSLKTLISSTSEVTVLSNDLLSLTPPPKCSSLKASMTAGELSPSRLAYGSPGPLCANSTINGSPDHSFSRWPSKEEEQQELREEDYGGGSWEDLYKDDALEPSSNWRPWPTTYPGSLVKSDYLSRPSYSSPLDADPAAFTREFHDYEPLMSQCGSMGTDSKPLLTPLGAGLANMGNTCFLNAIFQCFTHTVPFVQGLCLLDEGVPSHHVDDDAEFCLLSAVRDHIFLALSSPGNVMFPATLVNNLNNISPCFRRHAQEDAHEFLQCVLDKLDTCWAKCNFRAQTESSSGDTLVKQVFGGRLVSQLRCCNCGHCSDTYEPLIDLSLEIEDADNLDGALRSFTKVEEIEDVDVKITCDSCKEKVPVKKQLMLDQAPSILTFHLKRFKSNGYFVEKIDKDVEYPLELDLTPFTIHSDSQNVEQVYELYAVVVHNGWSSTSGHYFCYIRASPESWYEFDDSKVINVQPEVALSQRAYLLFYARKGTNWPSCLVELLRNYDPWHTSPKSVLDYVEPLRLSSSLAVCCNVKEKDRFLDFNEAEDVCKDASSFTCEGGTIKGSKVASEGGTSNIHLVTLPAVDELLKDEENIDEEINKINKYVEWGTSQLRCDGKYNRAEIGAFDVEIVVDKDSLAPLLVNEFPIRETDHDCKGDDGIIWIDGNDQDFVAENSCVNTAIEGDEKICNDTSSSETSLGSKGAGEVANCADYLPSSPRNKRPDKCSEELLGSQRSDKYSEELQEARMVTKLRDSKRQSRTSLGKQLNKRMNQKRKEALRTASRFSGHRHKKLVAAIFSNPSSVRKRRKN